MRYLFALLLILAGCGSSSEEKRIADAGPGLGLALFGLMSPNAGAIVERFTEIQKGSAYPATSILWGSFGNNRKYLDYYLAALDGRENIVQIHLFNEAGRRNERLGAGDLMPFTGVIGFNDRLETATPEVVKQIQDRVRDILALTESYPHNTRWILSLGLESQYTVEAQLALLDIVQDVWHYEISYNPLNGDCSYMPDWVLCETHGPEHPAERARCILSLDGFDSGPHGVRSAGNSPLGVQAVLDFIKRGRDFNCITLLWSAQTQGVDRAFTPTLNRTFRLDDETFIFLRDLVSEQVKAIKSTSQSDPYLSKNLPNRSLGKG